MSPQTHKLRERWFVILQLVLALAAYTIEAVPTFACDLADSDDDCLEAVMHPDLRRSALPIRLQDRDETQNAYWLQKGKEFVSKQAKSKPNKRIAKNIILFLGDGMGLTTFTAARNLLGGEEHQLSFEKFPHTGFAKTYSLNTIVPDSACTATAYLCGVKGNDGTIGVNGRVERDDCDAMRNISNYVHSIAKWALDAGKSAGLVTTARVTHASPAGVYAHVADRDWENDAMLAADCGQWSGLQDIALQLVHGEVGKQLKVILGGGKREFTDPTMCKKGRREDGRNLIDEYLLQSTRNAYVETREELQNLDLRATDRVLGLFHNSHLDYNMEAAATQPTLEEMTVRAIEMLQKNENGYFLFVEGGRIDTAHHQTMAEYALDETVEFSKAIEVARELTSPEDTLIVVTADHSHAFSISGYQDRGSNIFDLAPLVANDNKPYLSLSYANGPSFGAYYNTKKNKRRDPEDAHDSQKTYPATVPLESETHAGEDVVVFASGPSDYLFTGVYEQNTIPHLMAYAACVGDGLTAC